jgi:hypothetical protein
MDGTAGLPPRHGDGLICPLPLALRGLADARHWVIWRWTDPVPGRKPDKPLFRASDPWRHASTQDPASWDSFGAAMGAIAAGEADGAGYVLRDDAEHIFLDLDNCREPATGTLADWAQRLVEEADSYTEVTPSGRGLRIIGVNESLSAPIHRRVAMPEGGSVEIFHRCPRYVTVSGQRLTGTPDRLRPICDLATDLLLLAQPSTSLDTPTPDSSTPRSNPDAAGAPEDIAAALAQIPNPDLPWDEWSRIGMAAWRASAGSAAGLAAWTAWSAKSRKHSDAACQERWQHWFRSPPDRIGFASLYTLARRANPLWVKPSLVAATLPRPAPQAGAQGGGTEWEGEVAQPTTTPPSAAQSAPVASLVATPFDPADLATLRPREWVYGHFLIRRFVSVLGAPGGTGKTAYAIAVALSVALGRPLVEEAVHSPGPVWIYNLEDPRDELLRRVQAALIAHRIPATDLASRLYLDSGREQPLILATRLPDGSTVATPLVEALIAELTRRQVRLLIIDPFVKSHRLEENRNDQVDFAATLWSQVADAAGCAILLVHHFRKGGIAGDADAFRGASALVDAARAAVALSVMSEREAESFKVPADQRRFHVRADNAKLNLAPPPDRAVWLQLRSVDLPNGDRVQAVQRWEPPTAWEGLSGAALLEVLREIDAAPDDDLWCVRKQAGDRWAGKLLTRLGDRSEQQAGSVLTSWEQSGLLRQVTFTNKNRKERQGYRVYAEKYLEMQREFGSPQGRHP